MKTVNKRLVTCSLRATPEMRARLEELGSVHTRNLSAQLEHMVKIADLVIQEMGSQEIPRIRDHLRELLGKTASNDPPKPLTAARELTPVQKERNRLAGDGMRRIGY